MFDLSLTPLYDTPLKMYSRISKTCWAEKDLVRSEAYKERDPLQSGEKGV